MTLQQKLAQADDYLDMLKDKAKETDELAKENLHLKIDYQQANDIIVEQQKEIERLNNIINKIKECLSKNRVYITGERNLAFELDDILKGVDKE